MKNACKLLLLLTMFASCSRMTNERAIPFKGVANGRELGGLVMQDGRSIVHGKLVRSGDLSEATDKDVAILKDRFHLTNESYARYVKYFSSRVRKMGGGEDEVAFIRATVGASVEDFEKTLDLIDAQYGSLSAYLEKALGFTAQEQEQLRNKYLE